MLSHDPSLDLCRCGSGLTKFAIYDARGIFCTYACEKCEVEKKKEFRSEIFDDPDYYTDEPIGEDE